MRIKTEKFIEVLGKLRKVVVPTTVILEDALIVFGDSKVYAFDPEMEMIVDFESGVKGKVLAKLIYPVMDAIASEEEIDLEVEKNYLKIEFPSHKSKIMLSESDVDIPNVNDLFSDWKKLTKDFVRGVDYCVSGVDTTGFRLELNAVKVDRKNIFSSDGFRIMSYKLDDDIGIESLLGYRASELLVFLGFPSHFAIRGERIAFKYNDGVILIINSMASKVGFPKNLERFFPRKLPFKKFPSKEKLIKVLKRILDFPRKEGIDGVLAHFSGRDRKFVGIYSDDFVEVEETVELGLDESLSFEVDFRSLKDAVGKCDEYCFIREEKEGVWLLHFRSDDNKCRFLVKAADSLIGGKSSG